MRCSSSSWVVAPQVWRRRDSRSTCDSSIRSKSTRTRPGVDFLLRLGKPESAGSISDASRHPTRREGVSNCDREGDCAENDGGHKNERNPPSHMPEGRSDPDHVNATL